MERPIYSSEECMGVHDSMTKRIIALELIVSDHAQRFDTFQTPVWKRVVFWLDGWPWHDLNAERRSWRPWHRGR